MMGLNRTRGRADIKISQTKVHDGAQSHQGSCRQVLLPLALPLLEGRSKGVHTGRHPAHVGRHVGVS